MNQGFEYLDKWDVFRTEVLHAGGAAGVVDTPEHQFNRKQWLSEQGAGETLPRGTRHPFPPGASASCLGTVRS